MNETERRYTAVPVEIRARGDRNRIGGYAAVFNRMSQNLGGFVERVAPGFFNDSRSRGWPDVLARYNHDDNMLLGTTGAGTLTLEIDSEGLLYEVDPPQSRADVLELVSRGDVRKSSFAFRTFEDEWNTTDQGFPQRTLVTGQLVDVAPVNAPAYLDTTAGLRSLAAFVHVDVEEVRRMAQADELRRFFHRSDGPRPPAKPIYGPQAVATLLARQHDPWTS